MTLPAENMMYQASDVTGTSRTDREMSIADMRQVVDRSDFQAQQAAISFDTSFAAHMRYLFKGRTIRDTSVLSHAEKIDRARALVASTRSLLESDAFRRTSELAVVNKYSVEIYKKYAIPFACLLFVFVGCPMGILTKGGSFGSSALISLGFYVLYWISMTVGVNVGCYVRIFYKIRELTEIRYRAPNIARTDVPISRRSIACCEVKSPDTPADLIRPRPGSASTTLMLVTR